MRSRGIMTVLVAWLERPSMRKVWCRAARKQTLAYQDSVATACGHHITLPAGFEAQGVVTCPDCARMSRIVEGS